MVLVVRQVLAASGVAQVLVEALGRYAAFAHERLGLVQEWNTVHMGVGSIGITCRSQSDQRVLREV